MSAGSIGQEGQVQERVPDDVLNETYFCSDLFRYTELRCNCRISE